MVGFNFQGKAEIRNTYLSQTPIAIVVIGIKNNAARIQQKLSEGYTQNTSAALGPYQRVPPEGLLLYFKAQSLKHKDKDFNYGGNRAKNI